MKELSIFIDESGDFGDYSFHSPYYIIAMVFHDQSIDIQEQIRHLDTEIPDFKSALVRQQSSSSPQKYREIP